MEPGKLSKLLTIQADTVTRDAGGRRTHTPTTVTTRWAHVEPMAVGGEENQGEKITGKQSFRVTMRHYNSLDTSHQFIFTDNTGTVRTLGIDSIQDLDERGETHVCMCKEKPEAT
jgi:head-tail adaptor